MSTGLKMAASAIVASALTAALFLTLWDRRPAPPPPAIPAAAAPVTPPPPVAEVSIPIGEDPVVAEALSGLPVTRGDGVVRGRVTTPEGEGVEGVVIEATPRIYPARIPSGDAPPKRDLEEEIRMAVVTTHQRVTGIRRATTGTDGRYVLTGLCEVGHYLRPFAAGYEFRPARGHRSSGVLPGATVDFTANAVVAVRVVIDGVDDGIPGGVLVLSAKDEEGLKRAGGGRWNPDAPVLKLAPGTWWLKAVQGNDRERESEPREVTLEASAAEQTVVLTLLERPGLRGAIIVNDDLDVQRADAYALRFEGDKPPPLDPMGRNRAALRGRCDMKEMRYSFRDIGPGRYFVWVTVGSTRVMGSAVVDVLDRMVEQDIAVGIDDPERYVVVRVLGPDGEPLERVSFSTSYVGPGIGSSGGVEAIQRTDGSWFIASDPRSAPIIAEHPGGTWRIRVSHPELGAIQRPCDPASQRELEFRFGAASSVSVTVTGIEDKGFTGPAVLELRTHMEPNGLGGALKTARSGENRFVFDQVQPGEYFLVLAADGIQVDRLPIVVREGENPISWPLPTFHTVRVEVADKSKTARLCIRRIDPAGDWIRQFQVTTRDGEASYPFVPAGRYELFGTFDGENRSIFIDVPGQTHVLVE